MDITAGNHEIHKHDLLLLLAMKMIKIIDCMWEKNKIHIHIIIRELMRYVVILVKWGKLPEWSAKGPMTAKDRKFGFFVGEEYLYHGFVQENVIII